MIQNCYLTNLGSSFHFSALPFGYFGFSIKLFFSISLCKGLSLPVPGAAWSTYQDSPSAEPEQHHPFLLSACSTTSFEWEVDRILCLSFVWCEVQVQPSCLEQADDELCAPFAVSANTAYPRLLTALALLTMAPKFKGRDRFTVWEAKPVLQGKTVGF